MKSPKTPKIHTLDVRPLLARGEDPFMKIVTTIAAVHPGETLVIVSPFLPSPLIEKLQGDGFDARPERSSDGAWRTHFIRR